MRPRQRCLVADDGLWGATRRRLARLHDAVFVDSVWRGAISDGVRRVGWLDAPPTALSRSRRWPMGRNATTVGASSGRRLRRRRSGAASPPLSSAKCGRPTPPGAASTLGASRAICQVLGSEARVCFAFCAGVLWNAKRLLEVAVALWQGTALSPNESRQTTCRSEPLRASGGMCRSDRRERRPRPAGPERLAGPLGEGAAPCAMYASDDARQWVDAAMLGELDLGGETAPSAAT